MTSTIISRYFLLFVDYFSRKMWVYFLQLKYDVFNEFQNFKALIEKNLGCHISSLIYDTGGEFYLKDFNKFCAKHGIQKKYRTKNLSRPCGGHTRRRSSHPS